jgi:ornithine--oxo-acid transaminase
MTHRSSSNSTSSASSPIRCYRPTRPAWNRPNAAERCGRLYWTIWQPPGDSRTQASGRCAAGRSIAIGRNHPALREALKSVLDSDLPNLVQMDVSTLAGILAERLLAHVPYLDKAIFVNSGSEAVEAAIKFARAATRRQGIVYCDHAFHGLSYGALSLNGDDIFRNGFGPLLPDCVRIPFNDLVALEKALHSRTIAAFIVEPIQGKGVNVPADDYLKNAADLCRRYGTLFVADEVQTGLGRTGRFLAIEHWNVEPDMVLLAKTLSGGHVPVGAVLARKRIFDKVFDRMERAVAHGSTFGNNDLAMAAGIATLNVLKSEGLIENAARTGKHLLSVLGAMIPHYEFLREVRGRGLMIGIEFGPPRSLKLNASWHALETSREAYSINSSQCRCSKNTKFLAKSPVIQVTPSNSYLLS